MIWNTNHNLECSPEAVMPANAGTQLHLNEHREKASDRTASIKIRAMRKGAVALCSRVLIGYRPSPA